ncbi:hypothetical protein FH972_005714 [Carpinus fangiana]|uniref:Uncharacterized protein n=1 Tax=Carpinus fangiana TaxID=176857 RepID=A0A5N6QR34_9ROSI|nr:hypothetical protein FH972_005714 [Carpinus fangiana]
MGLEYFSSLSTIFLLCAFIVTCPDLHKLLRSSPPGSMSSWAPHSPMCGGRMKMPARGRVARHALSLHFLATGWGDSGSRGARLNGDGEEVPGDRRRKLAATCQEKPKNRGLEKPRTTKTDSVGRAGAVVWRGAGLRLAGCLGPAMTFRSATCVDGAPALGLRQWCCAGVGSLAIKAIGSRVWFSVRCQQVYKKQTMKLEK